MTFHIITLFPDMFQGFLSESLIGRAIKNKKIKVNLINLRDFATDKHKTVDDSPYGGGPGMILKIDVMARAINSIKSQVTSSKSLISHFSSLKTILLTPQGQTFKQTKAKNLSKYQNIILICGHYEGFDERIRSLVDEEISIGDYVLTGGEIPAMILVDTISRYVLGVLGKNASVEEESFSLETQNPTFDRLRSPRVSRGAKSEIRNFNLKSQISDLKPRALLEYPHYTRPENYKGIKVPKILLSGDHQKIARWRVKKAFSKTKQTRPDLLK